jgi:uncharacterized protein DUF5947
MAGPSLKRFLEPRSKPRAGEQCEMCAEPLPDEHGHVVDVANRTLMCTCKACSLLFTHQGAAQGRYRAVGDRYLHDPALTMTEAQWDALQIPVRMAFFFTNSAQGNVVAFYPSPAGATESLLSLDAWDDVVAANPAFADMEADVEALLIYRNDEDAFEAFLVPIDVCYELVGRVRLAWKGFDGGQEAWAEIRAFFARLRERSKRVGALP